MSSLNFSLSILNSPTLWTVIVGLLILGGIFIWKVSGWKTSIEADLAKVSEQVDLVYKIIVNRFGRDVQQTSSPVTLTDYGRRISKRITAEKIVNKYAEELNKKTEGMNAYQIQEECFSFCEEDLLERLRETDKKSFDEISEVAFDDGIKLEKITRVIGIELRDRVLSMCGKPQIEVDEHSPS